MAVIGAQTIECCSDGGLFRRVLVVGIVCSSSEAFWRVLDGRYDVVVAGESPVFGEVAGF